MVVQTRFAMLSTTSCIYKILRNPNEQLDLLTYKLTKPEAPSSCNESNKHGAKLQIFVEWGLQSITV